MKFSLAFLYRAAADSAALLIPAMLTLAVHAPARASDLAAADAATLARGAQLWADNCARCHPFRDAREQHDDQWQVSVVHMRIRAGLTGADSRDILAFLQGSNDARRPAAVVSPRAPSAAATLAAPETVYAQTCAACHGADGKGALPGVPNFTAGNGPLAQRADAELIQSILNGRQTPGAALAMPAKGGIPALTPADASALVRYLRERFQEQAR